MLLTNVICATCGVTFGMPETVCAQRENDGASFYCPYGHRSVFRPSKNDVLRKQLKECNDALLAVRQHSEWVKRDYDYLVTELRTVRAELTRAKLRAAGYKGQWLRLKALIESEGDNQ